MSFTPSVKKCKTYTNPWIGKKGGKNRHVPPSQPCFITPQLRGHTALAEVPTVLASKLKFSCHLGDCEHHPNEKKNYTTSKSICRAREHLAGSGLSKECPVNMQLTWQVGIIILSCTNSICSNVFGAGKLTP